MLAQERKVKKNVAIGYNLGDRHSSLDLLKAGTRWRSVELCGRDECAGPASLSGEGGNGVALFGCEPLGSGQPTLLGAELPQRDGVRVLRFVGWFVHGMPPSIEFLWDRSR